MVKSYKKKDERPQKAVSDLRSQGQEQQQLDYLASMHLQAPWAVQYPNQYRQHVCICLCTQCELALSALDSPTTNFKSQDRSWTICHQYSLLEKLNFTEKYPFHTHSRSVHL
ncbi:hypothetical protein DIPPA_17847 [Diplonema papillatum]|nr:hypothetical protein DIPPA_17847 [Diplonema papillatum]